MVRTLTNAFSIDRIHQAYILTGVRGVGKTTTARILARAFNYALPGRIDRPTVDMPELGVHCQAIIEFAPHRRDRTRRGFAHRRRRRARDHRERALPAGLGALQGLHHRRSPHALQGGLQCTVEDARRASAACEVSVRDHRGRKSSDHHPFALHTLRFEAHRGEPACQASAKDLSGGKGRGGGGGAGADRARRGRFRARFALVARSGDRPCGERARRHERRARNAWTFRSRRHHRAVCSCDAGRDRGSARTRRAHVSRRGRCVGNADRARGVLSPRHANPHFQRGPGRPVDQ